MNKNHESRPAPRISRMQLADAAAGSDRWTLLLADLLTALRLSDRATVLACALGSVAGVRDADRPMVAGKPQVSPYLERPLRTIEQARADIAAARGLDRPIPDALP